ncbi:MAG TPA: protein translocase subunit SecD [Caldilineaceae bacterium]|nr:protein translocase subunit SecD [Caldilineaceae bacterium]
MRNSVIALVAIFLIFLAACFVVFAPSSLQPAWLQRSVIPGAPKNLLDLRLGLDLRGGTQVLLQADLPPGTTIPSGAIDTAKTIVENRVNGLGVAEAVVQAQGEDRSIAELPGVNNPEQAIETLRSTGQLEFIDPAGAQLNQGMLINTTNRPTIVSDTLAAGNVNPSLAPYGSRVFNSVMKGDILRSATATQDQFNSYQINFQLTSAGSNQFYDYTSTHIGQPLAIVLDGRVLSAPRIDAPIRDQGVITGQFSREEAEALAVQMRYGALPVPLKVVDIRTIGATLGQDSLQRSLYAGVVGLIAVCIFMLAMYRLPGLLACIALLLYIVLNLAVFKLIPVTLTLPGIAGFILSIGIAVDANILIFERMKEELRAGRSIRNAVETGFARAWPAIFDSNLSALITCAVLFWFGSTFGASTVKGFAIALAIGVLLSMFSAVVVTRSMMRAILSGGSRSLMESPSMLGL